MQARTQVVRKPIDLSELFNDREVPSKKQGKADSEQKESNFVFVIKAIEKERIESN